MTEAEAEEGEELEAEDAEDKETLLTDPDEYHRTQRLKTIHERRRNVHKVYDEIDRYTTNRDHARQRRRLIDAVIGYISEVETVLDDAGVEVDLPENYPFDTAGDFATNLGGYKEDGEMKAASYQDSMYLFRTVNDAFNDVKPLIEEDDADEWEV